VFNDRLPRRTFSWTEPRDENTARAGLGSSGFQLKIELKVGGLSGATYNAIGHNPCYLPHQSNQLLSPQKNLLLIMPLVPTSGNHDNPPTKLRPTKGFLETATRNILLP
jgi:hypothetical protein